MKKTIALLLVILLTILLFPFNIIAEAVFMSPKEFLASLQSQNPGQIGKAYQLFTPELQDQIKKEDLYSLWEQITFLGGELLSIEEVSTEEKNQYVVHTLKLNMAKQNLLFMVTYDEKENIAGFFTSIAPIEKEKTALPDDVIEIEVTIGNEPWKLPGILTLPKEGKQVPAVVLVHGSGPNDKDETVGALTPFKDIAWELAKEGIASIRYDKRTKVYPNEILEMEEGKFTVEEETVTDAIEAGKNLKEHSFVDENKMFVIGHSLGAMVAPNITELAKDENVFFAGMVLLSGSPKTLTEIQIYQNQFALKQMEGQVSEEELEIAKNLITEEIQKYEKIKKAEKPDNQLVFGLNSNYILDLEKRNPVNAIKGLQLPTLIIQGGKDFQIPVTLGIEAWQEALEKENYIEYHLYPELNHNLVEFLGSEEVRYTLLEYNTPAKVDKNLLADLIKFIKQ